MTSVLQPDSRSVSPVKPDTEAEEPMEEAQVATQSEKGPGRKAVGDETSSVTSLDMNEEEIVPDGLITRAMIEEEEKLHAENLKEEEKEMEAQEKIWQSMTQDLREERYKRLQFLLSKSNMYTTYLLQRMKQQEEEEKKRMERRARKAERLQKKAEEEAARAKAKDEGKTADDENATSPPGRSMRKRKEVTSPEPQKKAPSKRGRKKRKLNDSSSKARGASDSSEEEESGSAGSRSGASQTSSGASQSQGTVNGLDIVESQGHEEEEELEKRYINGEEVSEQQPKLFVGGVLRPYQIEGYSWLKLLYENGVNGILADEMGLGKTVQCVAMMAYLAEMAIDGPFLVVAPLSTLPNWHSEFQRFAPQVPVILYHGDRYERKELRRKIQKRHTVVPGTRIQPCVITSYEMAMNDSRHLQNYEWKYLIVDEGHRIKNTHCRLIRELRMYSSTHRLLLTGTPLQNNLAELWSLLNFLLPEIFDDLGSFESWFDIQHLSETSSNEEIVASEQKDHILSILHQILTPFMLRRLKSDVELVIPPKKEVVVYASLTPLQQDFYKATVDKTILSKLEDEEKEEAELDSRGKPKRRCKGQDVNYRVMMESKLSREDEDIDKWVEAIQKEQQKRRMLSTTPEKQRKSQVTVRLQNVMMQLRKCCNHPYLLQHPINPKTGDLALNEDLVRASGKMLLLDKMLEQLKKAGHKVLIFSQMTRMLDLIEDYCILRRHEFCRLDGSCSVQARRESMDAFNNDKDVFVFLLSTRAGGLGINLTGADTVIIYDSDWNPQCDLQAQDRCHRIGQTKPVVVYRFVTAGTIDQKIVERAAAKRKLEKIIIHKGKFKSGIENFQTELKPISPEELQELLKTSDVDTVVRSSDGVASQRELAQLLDRSDLYHAWDLQLGKKSNRALESAARKVVTQGKCFKVLDTGVSVA